MQQISASRGMEWSARGFAASLLLTLGACAAPSNVTGGDTAMVRLALPPSLVSEQGAYQREVARATARVSRFFETAGVALPAGWSVDSGRVFEDVDTARAFFSEVYGVPAEQFPETFAGTVQDGTLFLISRQSYRALWKRLYPEWRWTEAEYQNLIVHELAHAAHERYALARFGTADAMGPAWFFEGLAVLVAEQFVSDDALMDRAEIETALADVALEPSYPRYGRLVRSLAALYPIAVLVDCAGLPDFPKGRSLEDGR